MNKDSTLFVGLDLGDRWSHLTILDPEGEVVEESRVPTSGGAMQRKFSALPPARPECQRLRSIQGVGPITALAFVLTLENPRRFAKSREVGPALGLVPWRDQSGGQDPQLHITKTGNVFLRRLLVGCAQYILGPFGPDCDLRRWGLQLAGQGGKNAKKRAVVAVARKLAIVMHRLWKTGENYNPEHSSLEEASLIAIAQPA